MYNYLMKIVFGLIILLISLYSSYESFIAAFQRLQSSPAWITVILVHFIFVYIFAYFFNKERKILTGKKSSQRNLYLILSFVVTLTASFLFLGTAEIVSAKTKAGGFPYVLPYIVIVLIGFGLYFKED
jgi:Na+/proline symporter